MSLLAFVTEQGGPSNAPACSDPWYLLQGRLAPPFTAVLSCELAPGGHVGRHVQQRDSELVIGLSGCGEAARSSSATSGPVRR